MSETIETVIVKTANGDVRVNKHDAANYGGKVSAEKPAEDKPRSPRGRKPKE